MSVETPCSLGNPDDWFIGKDGKQYRDDPILTLDELKVLSDNTDGRYKSLEDYAAAIEAAEQEKTRVALIRRRKARDACYTCPVRLGCLGARLGDAKIEFGTWGGYYEEQLRLIEVERERQQLRHP